MRTYKYCPKCGYIETYSNEKCIYCKTELCETNMEYELSDWSANEKKIIQQIYDKYKVEENPLYDLKAVEKRKDSEETTHAISLMSFGKNTLKCPYCNSTNVSKIGTMNRIMSVGLFGLGSSKIGKQFHCNNCNGNF